MPDNPAPKKRTNYIDNKSFYTALVKYKTLVADCEAEGKEPPQIPNYIGECIFKIAEGVGRRKNFSGYIFLDEMIFDAVENCIAALKSFDIDSPHATEPFKYFTKVVWWAFLRRIDKEKRLLYTKHKLTEHYVIHHGENFIQGTEDTQTKNALDNDYMNELVVRFEAKNKLEKARRRERRHGPAKGDMMEIEIETPKRIRKKKE